MRASVLRDGQMVYRDDVPNPSPGPREVLINVLACGVCGGDLHFAKHGVQLAHLAEQMVGAPTLTDGLDVKADVFMGHEFVGEVVQAGPGTKAPAPGTIVTSVPASFSGDEMHPRLYSNDQPGGYAEQMVLSADLLIQVPGGLDPRLAALAEPMAVGLHAVNKSAITAGAGAIVLGCGPAGIAVIAALKHQGVTPILATDYSPARRALGKRLGADETIDPRDEPVYDAWDRLEKTTPVIFECVGAPGMLNELLRTVPFSTEVVVVGADMEPDTITPYFGIAKEASLQFVQAYSPAEFAESLRRIAAGETDVEPLITGEVGLEDVQHAFDELNDPEQHCKILVLPNR